MAVKSAGIVHRIGPTRLEVPARRTRGQAPPAIGDVFNPYGMFVGIWIPEPLVKCSDISASAKLLFGRLTRFAGKDGRCFPSVKTLATELGMTDRQVQRLIRQLCEAGFLRKDAQYWSNGSQTSNAYFFLYHASLASALPVGKAAEHQTHKPVTEHTERGDKNVTPSIDVRVTGGRTSGTYLEETESNDLNGKKSNSSRRSLEPGKCVPDAARS